MRRKVQDATPSAQSLECPFVRIAPHEDTRAPLRPRSHVRAPSRDLRLRSPPNEKRARRQNAATERWDNSNSDRETTRTPQAVTMTRRQPVLLPADETGH